MARFAAIPLRALNDPAIPTSVRVLLALCSHAYVDDGISWPKASLLAQEVGTSVRAVNRHLSKWKERGYIVELTDVHPYQARQGRPSRTWRIAYADELESQDDQKESFESESDQKSTEFESLASDQKSTEFESLASDQKSSHQLVTKNIFHEPASFQDSGHENGLRTIRENIRTIEQRTEIEQRERPPRPFDVQGLWALLSEEMRRWFDAAQAVNLVQGAQLIRKDGQLILKARSSHAAEVLGLRYQSRIAAFIDRYLDDAPPLVIQGPKEPHP